jgi:alkylhydroperoxidase/carboxymuconolactone decarboxylase family protein YurZ
MSAQSPYRERLRRLSIGDRRYLEHVLGTSDADGGDPELCALDARTRALVKVGALVALDGPSTAFDFVVASALAAGATADDIVDAMLAVGATVGSAHLVSAAPKIAMALGYDVGADLEGLGPAPTAS